MIGLSRALTKGFVVICLLSWIFGYVSCIANLSTTSTPHYISPLAEDLYRSPTSTGKSSFFHADSSTNKARATTTNTTTTTKYIRISIFAHVAYGFNQLIPTILFSLFAVASTGAIVTSTAHSSATHGTYKGRVGSIGSTGLGIVIKLSRFVVEWTAVGVVPLVLTYMNPETADGLFRRYTGYVLLSAFVSLVSPILFLRVFRPTFKRNSIRYVSAYVSQVASPGCTMCEGGDPQKACLTCIGTDVHVDGPWSYNNQKEFEYQNLHS